METQVIRIERIEPNPYQVRRANASAKDLEKAWSETGPPAIVFPVRPHPDRPGYYQLASHHRRLRALKTLGETHATCEVRDLDDDRMGLEMAQENMLRKDFLPMEQLAAWEVVRFPPSGVERPVAACQKALGIDGPKAAALEMASSPEYAETSSCIREGMSLRAFSEAAKLGKLIGKGPAAVRAAHGNGLWRNRIVEIAVQIKQAPSVHREVLIDKFIKGKIKRADDVASVITGIEGVELRKQVEKPVPVLRKLLRDQRELSGRLRKELAGLLRAKSDLKALAAAYPREAELYRQELEALAEAATAAAGALLETD